MAIFADKSLDLLKSLSPRVDLILAKSNLVLQFCFKSGSFCRGNTSEHIGRQT
jgi:hypothetical protein